jgi:hypothetical protein
MVHSFWKATNSPLRLAMATHPSSSHNHLGGIWQRLLTNSPMRPPLLSETPLAIQHGDKIIAPRSPACYHSLDSGCGRLAFGSPVRPPGDEWLPRTAPIAYYCTNLALTRVRAFSLTNRGDERAPTSSFREDIAAPSGASP